MTATRRTTSRPPRRAATPAPRRRRAARRARSGARPRRGRPRAPTPSRPSPGAAARAGWSCIGPSSSAGPRRPTRPEETSTTVPRASRRDGSSHGCNASHPRKNIPRAAAAAARPLAPRPPRPRPTESRPRPRRPPPRASRRCRPPKRRAAATRSPRDTRRTSPTPRRRARRLARSPSPTGPSRVSGVFHLVGEAPLTRISSGCGRASSTRGRDEHF
mmetsp:Transcript_17660/g.50438  ORF Transcript_17660/g.50438 Transcript_17660/m.50438 type:complete len:217 (-) Transcript_17660:9693-10343(-)